MTSIITNNAATVALQTLRSINDSLETTNNRVSTGKKINDASDSASYWTIATTLTSDNSTLSAVTDAMALDSNAVDTASAGVEQVLSYLNDIKDALASSLSSNADRSALQKNIDAAVTNIYTAATSSISGSSGDNWLSVDSSSSGFTETKSLLASFSRSGLTVDVSTSEIDTGDFRLYDKSGSVGDTSSTVYNNLSKIATNSTFEDQYGTTFTVSIASTDSVKGLMDTVYTFDYTGGTVGVGNGSTISIKTMDVSELSDNDTSLISAYMKIVDATITSLTSGGATLGATSDRLDSQQTFATSLIDLNDSSIGTLVDADMEEESTRLKALQTQQSLAIQSLSIANSSSSNVLQLFQ